MSPFSSNNTSSVSIQSGVTYDVLTGTFTNSTLSPLNCSSSLLNSNSIGPLTISPSSTTDAKVKITGKGIFLEEDSDLHIGDRSLKDFMQQIESRLAMLCPVPMLESEWTELKQLGDQYRKLQKDIEEKMKTWNILQRKTSDGC